jgi:hypothetical protein
MSESVAVALIGVAGAVVGSVATVAASIASQCLKERAANLWDRPRKDLLRRMLEKPEHQWRTLDTLMHVIGADEETTKRLLIQIDARASEDGKRLWGLVRRNPLP